MADKTKLTMSLDDVIKMSNEDRKKQNRRQGNRRGNNRNQFFRNKTRKGSDTNINTQRPNLRGGNQRRFKQRVNKNLTTNLFSFIPSLIVCRTEKNPKKSHS